ncbi:MAG: class I SAM-dependent methyltransferase, partial [Terriglobia bacterium]
MKPTNALSWDERYRQGLAGGSEPAEFLRAHVEGLPRSAALDVAMGAGRNAVFLAECGWHVIGIEKSAAAIAKARELAQARGVTLDIRQVDLEQYELESEGYDLIVCFYYLERRLFPQFARALRPGGAIVFESYTVEQLKFLPGPRNPERLLGPNELYRAFRHLRLSYYRERVRGGRCLGGPCRTRGGRRRRGRRRRRERERVQRGRRGRPHRTAAARPGRGARRLPHRAGDLHEGARQPLRRFGAGAGARRLPGHCGSRGRRFHDRGLQNMGRTRHSAGDGPGQRHDSP